MTTTVASSRRRADAPSPAVAPPPGNPRFPLFDSLRGLAVLAVVVYHVFVFTGALDRRVIGELVAVAGGLGPTLFFAISGFLLYRPWVAAGAAGKPRPSTSRYLRRRALRILPAYWFALTVLAIFPGIVGLFSGRLVALLLLPAALRRPDARARHPRRLDAVRRGDLLSPAAAVGRPGRAGRVAGAARRARRAGHGWSGRPGRRGARGDPGPRCLEPARAAALVRAGMAIAVVSVAAENADGAWRARIGAVASRPVACWAGAMRRVRRDRGGAPHAGRPGGRRAGAADPAAVPEAARGRRADRAVGRPRADARRVGHTRASASTAAVRGAARCARAGLLWRLPLAPDDRRVAHPA